MRHKHDTNGRFRNPFVRPILFTACSLIAAWAAAATPWGQTELYGRAGWGRITRDAHGVELALPGISYLEFNGIVGPRWHLTITRGVLPFLAGIALAAWQLNRMRRICAVRRRGPGFCPACGYDLRASRDRCPECGRPILRGGCTPIAE